MKAVVVTSMFPNRQQPIHGTFCLERVRCLQKHADVRVLAPVPYWPSWRLLRGFRRYSQFSRIDHHELLDGIHVDHPRHLVLPKVGDFTLGLFYERALTAALKRLRQDFAFDVIDAHGVWPDGYAAMKASQVLDVPLCVTAHGSDVTHAPTHRAIRPFIVKTVQNADRVVAVSKAIADLLLQLGAPAERLRVIHNGVDVAKFRRIDRQHARQSLVGPALPWSDGRSLVCIAALRSLKQHDLLIDAVDLLVHRDGLRDVRLHIIGQGPQESRLHKRIQSAGLADNVRLVGPVPHDELYRWICASDFLCLTSRREGWPTVFFEAWACGVPVISTRAHGTAEAVSSRRYGLLVDEQNPDSVAASIKEAMGMSFDRDELIAYAKQNTWDRLQRLHYRELQQIVGARAGAAASLVGLS